MRIRHARNLSHKGTPDRRRRGVCGKLSQGATLGCMGPKLRANARFVWWLLTVALCVGSVGCSSQKSSEDVSEGRRDEESKDQPAKAKDDGNQGNTWNPKKTYAVIAGVLEWQDPKLTQFAKHHRKDQELYDVLRERGVPKKNMTLLLDGEATRAAVERAVEKTISRAPSASTFVFYYAGHGVKDDEGEIHFASYDLRGDALQATGLGVSRLKKQLKKFEGARVLLLADCCYSGGLRDVAKALDEDGIEAISLTSAEASNLSTENWTFSQTLIDGLRGARLADRDGDGWVTMGEMADEVGDAMKFREKQRSGFFGADDARDLRIAKVSGKSPRGKSDRVGSYVQARHDRGWLTARVLSESDDGAKVRFYFYSDAEDVRVKSKDMRAITFRRFDQGAELRVFWGGKLWDAKVLRREGDFHRITYPGWPSYWDEWVMSDRIASEEGSRLAKTIEKGALVDVEWRGTWYLAVVLQRQGDRALIHYDGYDDSWDEWVGPDRLRKR